MKKALPIGISDFRSIIENNGYYVDKTMLIAQWRQALPGNVTLITRPRRFGKTLNMTMLREFFDITRESQAIFEGLAIMNTPHTAELNQWPVIYLSFKDCKGSKASNIWCAMDILAQAIDSLPKPLDIDESDAKRLERIYQILETQDMAQLAQLGRTIYLLSKILYKHYHKKVIILIDEYDTPMTAAYENGYYDDVRELYSSLYSSALKDNPYLERAMLTGIHRMAKENIFSGLNNLTVCTVLSKEYQQYFGLTPPETEALLGYYNLSLNETVKAMYDGYLFGEQEIYNPWSILNYASQKKLEPFWVNTASNKLIKDLIMDADEGFKEGFETLLKTKQADVELDLNTSFFEVQTIATLWGLLLSSGYITVKKAPQNKFDFYTIIIPNAEVMHEFEKIVAYYTGFGENSLKVLFHALMQKDIERFSVQYQKIIMNHTSFYDNKENAYHMLFLGMSVYLDSYYDVYSNREDGYGRSDIVLKAKRPQDIHVVIEFKQGEKVERLSKEALAQIHQNKYYAGLNGEILLMGIAHAKKKCSISYDVIRQ